MKPFRKHVAIAIDGGGIRGLIVTRALAMLEEYLRKPFHEIFELAVGTSTGSIISAGIGADISAGDMCDLYIELGKVIFRQTWKSTFFPLTHYRYDSAPLNEILKKYMGNLTMGDFWKHEPPLDVVITAFDLVSNHTCFIKPWKQNYASWPVVKAVQASCTVPTYFPVLEGRYIDGGVGSYANPCYLAAYEAQICLNWNPAETTLISLGTGRDPHLFAPQQAGHMFAWQWLNPLLGAFLQSADDQQDHLVSTFFKQIDFRRFQVNLSQVVEMDDTEQIPELNTYGINLGQMILDDITDTAQTIFAQRP